MYDVLLMLAVGGWASLATLYWICLIVGGGLLIISSIAGGDADVDVDLDIDVDMDVDAGHAHAGSLTTWLSMQFLVFFMAMFGVVGVTMTHLSDYTGGVTLACAAVVGLLVGQGAHQLLRKLRKTSGDSTPKRADYVNKIARVTISVSAKGKGEVALRVGRTDRYVPAIALHQADAFSPDQTVGVVDYRDGVAEIVSREEFEFLTDSKAHA